MIEIPLTNAPGCVALVDDEDAPVAAYRWRLTAQGYVQRTVDRLLIHRAVLHAPDGKIVDHLNGDPLDNRRANLRIATVLENARNKAAGQRNSFTKFSGVIWNAQRSKWQAHIRIQTKLVHLGLFDDLDAAKRARAEAEVKAWGVQPRRREALEAALGRTLAEQLV